MLDVHFYLFFSDMDLCQFCGKFIDQISHKSCQKVNATDKILCEICGITVKSMKYLKSHQYLHSNKQFECDICQTSFKKSDYLIKHRLIHSNILYECQLCEKKYNNKSNLNRMNIIKSKKSIYNSKKR